MAGRDDYYREDGDFDDADLENPEYDSGSADNYDPIWAEALSNKGSVNGRPLKDDGQFKAGFGKFGKKKDDEGNDKYGLLKKGEQDASKNPNKNGKGGDKNATLGEKENNVPVDENSTAGKINNAVKGVQDIKSGNVIKGAGRLKKAGPLFAILGVMLGFGGASFMGQMSMTSSFIYQIQESFDSITPVQAVRSKSLLVRQLAKQGKKCIKAHYFRDDEFKVTKRMSKKLAKQGITIEDDNGVSVMRYTGDDGNVRTVVADRKQAVNGKQYFEDALLSDKTFQKKYGMAAAPWRTSIAAWFDSRIDAVLKFFKIKGRNTHSDFDADSPDANEKLRSTVTEGADTDTVGAKAKSTEIESEETTYNRRPDGSVAEETNNTYKSNTGEESISASDSGPQLKNKISGILDKAISLSTVGVNIYCAVADGVGAITAVVAAAQTVQLVNMAASIFEGIQKGQVNGDNTSPMHEIGNSLTKRTESTYTEKTALKKNPDSTGDEDAYIIDESKNKEIKRSRSAMESAGVAALYGGTTVNPEDASVKSLNPNTITKGMWSMLKSDSGVLGFFEDKLASIGSNVKLSVDSFKSCQIGRLAASYLQLFATLGKAAIEVGKCLATAFASCLFSAVKGVVKKVIKNAVIAGLKSALIGLISGWAYDHVEQLFKRKVIKDAVGEDLGNALVSGGNAYMGMNHRQNGGAVADKESLVSYYQEKDKVIAENARIERATRSPFDASSKYTFLGSLATQLVPLASSMTSITSAIGGASTVLGNAMKSITPSSSAISAGIRAQAEADNTAIANPYLADIGGVGDAFGNPYIITDTRTLNNHPADIVNDVDALTSGKDGEEKNLLDVDDSSAENVPKIGKNSELAKYIVYCGQRQSPFGMADQSIATEVDSTAIKNDGTRIGKIASDFAQGALNSVPVVGDGLDITSNKNKLNNIGWISGESCVINNNSSGDGVYKDSISWDRAKKYQRFIEDQRLAEAEGIIEKSAVTEYLAEYYKEHPLDNSYEGILARYSGLTKDRVIATLDLIDVVNFVANYNPTDLYPYPHKEKEKDENIELEDEYNYYDNTMLATHDIIYDNKRYRSYAV